MQILNQSQLYSPSYSFTGSVIYTFVPAVMIYGAIKLIFQSLLSYISL